MPKAKTAFRIPSRGRLLEKIEAGGAPGREDTFFVDGRSVTRCCWWVCDSGQCISECMLPSGSVPPPPPPCTTCWEVKLPSSRKAAKSKKTR
jgi:hypothetical protein